MKVVILGAGGFVGRYLMDELEGSDHTVVGGSLHGDPARNIYSVDIADMNGLRDFLEQVQPDAVVHLAARAGTVLDQGQRVDSCRVNVIGTINVSQSCLEVGVNKLLVVSSGLVYGGGAQNGLVSERDEPIPRNAYGLTKLSAELAARSILEGSEVKCIIGRPFNHIGPNQSVDFVTSALASRIAALKTGGELEVGNLESFRDFTDVRDIVRGYRYILEEAEPRPVYVLGSGEARSIRDVLDGFKEISGKQFTVVQKTEWLRNEDSKVVLANSGLACNQLGWQAKIPFEKTLTEIYQSHTA